MFYGTVAGFRAYHIARGRDADAGVFTNEKVEEALQVASEWIDAAYRFSFPGHRVLGRDQEREWPRYDAADYDGYFIDNATVPTEVDNATYEAAFKEATTSGSLTKDYTPSKYRKVSISGAVSIEYDKVTAQDIQTQFTIVTQILSPILTREARGSSLSGSVGRV